MKRTVNILSILFILISIAGHAVAQAGYSTSNPIDIGSKGSNFTYSDTKNTNDYSSNSYIYNLNTGVVFYKLTVSMQMDITISHCGSALSNTYIRLLKSTTLSDAVATSNSSSGECSSKNQAYLKVSKLQPGTYYIAVQGGSYGVNGSITTSIQGNVIALAEYNLGSISSTYNYSHSQDTRYSVSKWGYRPTNDVFYRFFIASKPMKLKISNSMASQYGSCVSLTNSSLTSTIATKCFPANNPNNESLDIDFLVPGSYYIISEGAMEDGVIKTWIEISDLLEFNMGERESSFEYTHTQNTNEYLSGSTDGIFYRIDIRKKMDMKLTNSAIFTNGSCISLLNSSKSTTIATKCFSKSNPSKEYLEVKNVNPGIYYILSKGKSEEGVITTNIEGNTLAEYDLGTRSSQSDYFHTQNTNKSTNEWNNKPTNDAMYKITISGNPIDLRVSNSMSSASGSCISILNSAKTSTIATKSFGKGNLSNDYLEIKKIQPGVYYIVSEGLAENGDITTYINLINGDIKRNKNYIKTRTYTSEDASKYLDAIQYFDGLGRPIQTIQQGITPKGYDLATYQELDQFGRESKSWLPSVLQNNNGDFAPLPKVRTNAVVTYADSAFSQPVYETSPLNKILEQYGPGQDWKTNKKAVRTGYLANTGKTGTISLADSLVCALYVSSDDRKTISINKSKNYDAGELYVTRIKDEDNNVSYEFKDKLGQVVLTRQINGTEMLDTYYIYDSFGNKRVVLPPILSDMMPGNSVWTDTNTDFGRYAYMYKYDNYDRCIAKKIPGADWIYYVYDKADRLVFTQDGEQRKKSEWTFTIPDVFGRIVLTGTCKNALTYTADPLGAVVVKADWAKATNAYKGYTVTGVTLTTPAVLSVNYYDSYEFLDYNQIPNKNHLLYGVVTGYDTQYTGGYKGLLTGTIAGVLDSSASPDYLYTAIYYDNKGRVIQTKETNLLAKGVTANNLTGGIDKTYIAYNFTGQPVKKFVVHQIAGKADVSETYAYTYDHAGRLLTTTHQFNNGTTVTLAQNTYDELGRLSKNVKNNQANLTTAYTYNVRSWTKTITSPLFTQTLYYNEPFGLHGVQYGGNISAMIWKTGSENQRIYAFKYDNLSQLTHAAYDNKSSGGSFSAAYTYDKHGNMKTLTRLGKKTSTTYDIVDNLTITHTGNQLLKIEDAIANISLAESADFKNYSNVATEYYYNANGAMYKDLNKGISDIQYNSLNLPRLMDIKSPVAEARNEYTYSASGTKLKVVQKWNPNYSTAPVIGSAINTTALTSIKTTDYVGNMIYENGNLKRILVEGGYIEDNTYHFYLTDHLGNNRVVAKADGTFIQKNHYYPFGMAFAETPFAEQGKQPYKYNGKEFDSMHGLNWYDYSARQMDGMRFTSVDPHAEKYYSWSPYVYCFNNPIRFVDPTGKDGVLVGTPAERQIIVNDMQKLTNDKLSVKSNGTLIITKLGTENKGKSLTAGTALIRSINSKEAGSKTTTISIGAAGNGNSAVTDDRDAAGKIDWTNATNGTGANATVTYDPTANPSILTTDPVTGNVSGATRPTEIGLGHELIHATHINKGNVDLAPDSHTYQTSSGNVTQTVRKEELKTVGTPSYNTNTVTENKIRKEQKLNTRGAY